jgi:predicted amidohydrolase YtcJ
MRRVALTVLALFAPLHPSATTAQTRRDAAADLVLVGGKIFTADTTRPWVEALAIRGERIVAVGSTHEILDRFGASARIISLGGRVVIPGINDAHDHMGYSFPGGVTFDIGSRQPQTALADLMDSVRAIAPRTRRGAWISATTGISVSDVKTLNRSSLDSAAPNNPVMLKSVTGHTAIMNSAALRAMGIREGVHDPLGGSFERDAAGRLNGVVREYAYWGASRAVVSALPARTLDAAMRNYAHDGMQYGITSVQDMADDLTPELTMRVVHRNPPPFRLRIIKFSIPDEHDRRIAEWDAVQHATTPLVEVSGRKWILEGTAPDRNALRRSPYPGRPDWYGALNFAVDTVRAVLREALANRDQLMLHVGGDSALSLVLSMMQSLAPDSAWRPLRVRFEHGDGLVNDLQPAARRMGIIVVQNPTHFGAQPLASIAAAGIPIAIGSDGARNPYLNIMLAVDRRDNPGEAITREAAVIAYTRGSAFAQFAEHQKGTLAPGMLADLAVLSQDIFIVPLESLPSTVSVLTMVGGRIVYRTIPGAK